MQALIVGGFPKRNAALDGEFLDLAKRARPDGSCRHVDHTAKTDIVSRVGNQSQVRDHVLDFLAVVEPLPAQQQVRDARGQEGFFQGTRLGVGAIENREIAVLAPTIGDIGGDATGDDHRLVLLGARHGEGDGDARLVIRPELLVGSRSVLCNHGVGTGEDGLGGPIVALQLDDLGASELKLLGKEAHLSLSARQRVRDRLFKKMGQLDLIDAVQTKADVDGLIMPLAKLLTIFKPQRISFGMPATAGIALGVMLVTFTTGALAHNAQPGSGIFYTVRQAIEDMQVALVADPVQKANKRIEFVSDRLAATATVIANATDPANDNKIEPVIEATRKAVVEAKAAVDAANKQVETTDETSQNITHRLQLVIDTQREQLATIAESYTENTQVASSIAAVNAELDQILQAVEPAKEEETTTTDKPAIDPADTANPPADPNPATDGEVALVPTKFDGVLVADGGRYFLLSEKDGIRHTLIFDDTSINFADYIGRLRTAVFGPLTEQGIVVRQIFIDNKLVWEQPNKTNFQNLPEVDDE